MIWLKIFIFDPQFCFTILQYYKFLNGFLMFCWCFPPVNKMFFVLISEKLSCAQPPTPPTLTARSLHKCDPLKLLMWPANDRMYCFLLVCLIETHLDQGKNFVVSLWNFFWPAIGFGLCIPDLMYIKSWIMIQIKVGKFIVDRN